MAVNGITGANYLLTRLGNSYAQEDCVHAAVINLIRNCPGGDKNYRTAGCTELWNSIDKAGKYRHITRRMTLSEAKADGLLIGDLPVIYDERTGKCEHVAYYMGGIGGFECIHSSASKGCVCGTTLKNGFTHVLRHRDIEGVTIDAQNTDTTYEQEHESEEKVMDTLYFAKVATQGGALNLRSTPSKGNNIICEIPFGTELPVVGNSNPEWTMVVYNGKSGYVSSGYLAYSYNAPVQEDADDAPVLQESTALLGGTWGVFIPCSGKSAAKDLAAHFINGRAMKANLDD